ncbi:hypothetical protein ACC745_18630 [Rhizobium ruizarguesonis]
MSETTELRNIRIVGPRLALTGPSSNSKKFTWHADLSVAYLGKEKHTNPEDRALVNYTQGLRVVLQAPDEVAINIDVPLTKKPKQPEIKETAQLRTPHLLIGSVLPRGSTLTFSDQTDGYALRAAVPESDPDKGTKTLGVSAVTLTPLDPWPTPQTTREIEVPRFAIAEHRLRVLVSVSSTKPLGFLALAKISNMTAAAFVGSPSKGVTDPAKLPHVELQLINIKGEKGGSFVAVDLTPDGIELRGTIVNPLKSFVIADTLARIDVILRLVHRPDPLSSDLSAWSLELVREEDKDASDKMGNRIRRALSLVRAAFAQGQNKPLVLDIDTAAEDLAVRWPLEQKDESLRLPGSDNDGWRLWVDADALRARLRGSPVRDGELPTEVAFVPNLLSITGSAGQVALALDSDRRDVSMHANGADDILGPRVVVKATDTPQVQVSISDPKGDLIWLLDQKALARTLVEQYSKAGVHPYGATTTYAFVPLVEGWLQLPLRLDYTEDELAAKVVSTEPVGFDGSVEFVLDDSKTIDQPRGRRLEIAAADYVRATATFDEQVAKELQVEVRGAAGTVDGVLWVAAGSPSPENILPNFDAGPVALMGPALAFNRLTDIPEHLMPLTSGTFAPNSALDLNLPVTSSAPTLSYLWRGYSDMPLVTAISMTRTSETSGNPSSTRGLLCREIDRASYAITLVYGKDQGFTSLTLTDKRGTVALDRVPLVGGTKSPFGQVPLVPVTLPGIELHADNLPFEQLTARLRFDLPALDELFANTRLPEKAPLNSQNAAPEPPPPDAPTSLDFGGLMTAWQKAVDRLDLSRIQAANAFEFEAQGKHKVAINTLFEGATWSPHFALAAKVTIETNEYAFGTYDLAGAKLSGRNALQGLSKAFDVNPNLVDAADTSTNPLRVIGFAAALWEDARDGLTGWRDTRAAITAKLPTAELFGDKEHGDRNGLLIRNIGVIDLKSMTTAKSSRTTLVKPIPIALPIAADRTLGLWFRDLPLESKSTGQLSLVKDADGPELTIGPRQSAFDRELLPRSIYEWRLCNDAKGDIDRPPSAYEVAIGPFQFRPLRLLDLVLEKIEGWRAGGATICGTLSLAESGIRTLDKGPFEPELAYATGNLVAISLVKNGDGLTFAGADWSGVGVDINRVPAVASTDAAAQISFRMAEVPVFFGSDARTSGTTTLLLGLTASKTAGAEGLPQFSAATLTAVLFGRRVVFDNGAVTINSDEITATFSVPGGVNLDGASGILLNSVKVAISSGQPAKVTLEGQLKILAVDRSATEDAEPLEVVQYALGGSLYWLHHEIEDPCKPVRIKDPCRFVEVDHDRGVIDITATISAKSVQPIAGLTAETAVIRLSLTVALVQSEPNNKSNASYIYTSVSGFGEYCLSSMDGPTRRFDNIIAGNELTGGPIWTSQINVDLSLNSRESRIHWPIDSLPDTVQTLDGKYDFDLAELAARVSARALRGSLSAFDVKKTLKHIVTMIVAGQPLQTSALRVQVKDKKRRVGFATPWTFQALAEHQIIDPQVNGRTLAWTTLDHVTAIDAHILVGAAKDAVKLPQPFKVGIFGFAARYKDIYPYEGAKSPVVKGGLVLRAFAQAGFPVEALALELAKLPDPSVDGIIVHAAGPTTIATKPMLEGPFWPDMSAGTPFISNDRHGVVLALPWLTAIDNNYQLGDVLSSFNQAPEKDAAIWDAPDVDWAAGSPAPLARRPAVIQAVGTGSAADIAGLLASALRHGPDRNPVRALAPVEQLFLRPVKGGATIKERPIWLRSLLAVRTVWLATADVKLTIDNVAMIDDRVIMVVPSGEADGEVARFKLGPRRYPNSNEADVLVIGTGGQIVAIDRERTRFDLIPATEFLGSPSGSGEIDAVRRSRLASRASLLVKEPVAVVAVASQSTVSDQAASIWIRVGIPPDLDDGALDIPIEVNAEDRLYASPALGWPTVRGTGQAATGAIGMGEDRAFQDAGPEEDPSEPPLGTLDDVKNYGSGLSGRAASLSLPARADTGDRPDSRADPFIDTRSPVFIALGRKMIFERPAAADLPIVSPPASHLTPTEARVVVPVSQDLKNVLKRVIKGQAAPFVPPHLERTSFGLRPGAMQAEFDTLLFTDGLASGEIAANKQEDMSPEIGRFGRPGHAGPRLVRQLRPPREPALPRVPLLPQDFVTSHGRRTFVELDDHITEDKSGKEQDTRFPTPFRLFEGVATILRRHYDKDPPNGAFVDESYRIRPLDMPLLPEWDGKLTLHVTSPSYPLIKAGLPEALARLGLLREGAQGLGATLSIDRFVVRFCDAVWSRDKDAVNLKLRAEPADLADIRSRLDAVRGDSEVVLQLRCGQEADSAVAPSADDVFVLATNPDQTAAKLEPETCRQFALRLPVRPTGRPSLEIGISTLVFADPSYDRELSGPGPSDSQRDASGLLWKLALDRFEYGTDTPSYFAFGPIDARDGLFTKAMVPKEVWLTLQRQPARKDEGEAPPIQDLIIANVKGGADKYEGKYQVASAEAYGITLEQLRTKDGKPVEFLDGDQIVVLIGFTDPAGVSRNLSMRAMVVPRPIIAPPPAVYALVAPVGDPSTAGKKTARVALQATAPLPQRIEFPSLLIDLAIGHIRRRALFIWPTTNPPTQSPERATLIKIDRAGGGQLPERLTDICSRLPLRMTDVSSTD